MTDIKFKIACGRKEIVEFGTRKISVIGDVDVVVVGGGPAGIAAAVSASRSGSNVMLVERYPYLGGMATGGLVLLFMEYDRYNYGILKETVDRLSKLDGGVAFPAKTPSEEAASEKPPIWVEGQGITSAYNIPFDPELLKFVSDEMLLEAGVKPVLNSLFVEAITENNVVNGVIIETKEGRQAILAKVTIDATGDGDVFAKAGAPFKEDIHPWGLALSYRVRNVDIDKALKFRRENAAEYNKLVNEHMNKEGYRLVWFPTTRSDVVVFFQWLTGLSATKREDLTTAEIDGRRKIMAAVDFFRKNIPGFESSFLNDTSPQIGTRESRRVKGEYTLTKEDVLSGKRFDDVIAPNPFFDIPYRCLVPKKVDGLLVAGRCISTTHEAQAAVRMICPCYATGEAAGAAAAIAAKAHVEPRNVNVTELQTKLTAQGVVIKKP